jgi:hypothetical protein
MSRPNSAVLHQYISIRSLFVTLTCFVQYAARHSANAKNPLIEGELFATFSSISTGNIKLN